MKALHTVLTILLVGSALVSSGCKRDAPQGRTVQQPRRELAARKSLTYLGSIPEIDWYEVENNNVYIAFGRLPADWRMILKGAALQGERATNFGFHAWACDSQHRGWRPGQPGYYGEETARYGRIE